MPDREPITAAPQARAHALLGLALNDELEAFAEAEPKEGDVIGRYTLKTKLGEGGFGVVWRAEQKEPIHREVALKVIRSGLDSRAAMARFRTERQALARMSHPNIATVLDAGSTEEGRLFFVMELIEGPSIIDYAKVKQLNLEQRVELFMDVCLAVQHAHQRAVLHRDLKPSNILVAEKDGKPVPKVIDFGIAKAMSSEADGFASVVFTAQGLLIGTPHYMAPEHSQLGSDEVDVRADVFSLGAILYELLTGRTPLDFGPGKPLSAHQVMRRLCEEEPLRPSTIILRSSAAKAPQERVIARALREELDWVVLKALEKQPDNRYPSVTALSDDLQAYLRNAPLSVGPPSILYQLRKLAQRHRTAVTVTTVVLTTLISASIVTAMAYVDEAKARRLAQELQQQSGLAERKALSEAEKSQTLVTFLTDLLARASEHVKQGRNAEVLRLALSDSVKHIDDFADQPELQAQLYQRLAEVYLDMDEPREALPLLVKQWQTQARLHGEQDQRTLMVLYGIGLAQSRAALRSDAIATYAKVSQGLEATGKTETKEWFESRRRTAIELIGLNRAQEAGTILRGLESQRDGKGLFGSENNGLLRSLAEVHWMLGEFAEAEALLNQSLAQLRKPTKRTLQRSRAATLRAFSKLEVQRGNLPAAAKRLEEVIEMEQLADGESHHQLINRWIEVARLYAKVARYDEATNATRKAIEIARERGHTNQQVHALQAASEIHEQAGDLEIALALRRECEPLAAQDTGNRDVWLEQRRAITALLTRLGPPTEAERSARLLWQAAQAEQRLLQANPDLNLSLLDTMIAAGQTAPETASSLLRTWQQLREKAAAAQQQRPAAQ